MARYDHDFEPLLLEDQTATLFGTGLPLGGLNVKCLAVGALPEYVNDFGTLTAGQWDVEQTDTNLIMNLMELSQLRMRVLDDMQVRLKNPGSVRQWSSRDVSFHLPQFPMAPDTGLFQEWIWKASEFFVFETNNPSFDLFSTADQLHSRILFSGWRFKLETIDTPGRIKVWISEWPSISSKTITRR